MYLRPLRLQRKRNRKRGESEGKEGQVGVNALFPYYIQSLVVRNNLMTKTVDLGSNTTLSFLYYFYMHLLPQKYFSTHFLLNINIQKHSRK